jgi:regulator of sigma E protease
MELLQSALVSIVAFVLVLSVVVFVHEYGHFQAARWCRVAIDTFSIGFGKRLIGWRDRQGVEWKVGALPLGGYVKFKDDADPASSKPATADYTDPAVLEADRRKGLFHAQPVGARAFVVAAGPLTNFIFAVIAFAAVGLAIGRDLTDYANLPVRVGEVQQGGAGEAGGLQRGDVIKAVDGAPVATFGAFRDTVMASPGRPLTVEVERYGLFKSLTITPKGEPEGGQTVGRIGVGPLVLPEDRNVQPMNPLEALGFGAEQTWRIIALHGEFFAKLVSPNPPTDQVSGVIGIFDQTGKVANAAVAGDKDMLARAGDLAIVLISWAAMLSVAVGIVNLLPIPILDGGHLVFYAVEAIRGRRLSDRAQEWSFRAGLVVLLSLFIFATWNDLSRILPRILAF